MKRAVQLAGMVFIVGFSVSSTPTEAVTLTVKLLTSCSAEAASGFLLSGTSAAASRKGKIVGGEAAKQKLSPPDWLLHHERRYKKFGRYVESEDSTESFGCNTSRSEQLEPQIVNMAADTLKGGFLPADQQQSAFFIQAAGTVTTHQPASWVLQDPPIYRLEPAEAACHMDEADRYILLEILITAAFLNSAFQPISRLIHHACQVCLFNPLKRMLGLHYTTSCLSGCFANSYSNCDMKVLCDWGCWVCSGASNWLPSPHVRTHDSVR